MIFTQIDESVAAHNDLKDPGFLEQAAMATLDEAGGPEGTDLSLVITDDSHLRRLNREFLEIDAPTDVLSFPSGETDPESGVIYLGDVVISLPRALAQSAMGRHDVQSELQLLVVHGVLHLLGYDHAEEAEKAIMWGKQAEILRKLGSAISGPA